MSLYPNDFDNPTTLPLKRDGIDTIVANDINSLISATEAIESELGKNPSGIYGSVVNRFDLIDAYQTIIKTELDQGVLAIQAELILTQGITVGDGVSSVGVFNGSTFAALQQAIDFADGHGGGTITIKDGYYNYTDGYAQVHSNTQIIGNSNVVIYNDGYRAAIQIAGSNVSIEHINFMATSPVSQFITNNPMSAVEITNLSGTVSNITVKDCIFDLDYDSYGIGIYPTSSVVFDSIQILNNRFVPGSNYEGPSVPNYFNPAFIGLVSNGSSITLNNTFIEHNVFYSDFNLVASIINFVDNNISLLNTHIGENISTASVDLPINIQVGTDGYMCMYKNYMPHSSFNFGVMTNGVFEENSFDTLNGLNSATTNFTGNIFNNAASYNSGTSVYGVGSTPGIYSLGGPTNGAGVSGQGVGSGDGVVGVGGAANGHGGAFYGAGTGAGVYGQSGPNGVHGGVVGQGENGSVGVQGTGGVSNGTGVNGVGGLPGGVGVAGHGVGNGNGVNGYGSGVGFGVLGYGGATNGYGGAFYGSGSTADGVVGYGAGDGNGVDGYGAGDGYGVYGVGGGVNGRGVGGFGTGNSAGVIGLGGSSGGTGVRGVGTASAPGLKGEGGTNSGYGVLGYGGATNGYGGAFYGAGTGAGVYGQSGPNGVHGGVVGQGENGSVGVQGTGGVGNGAGVNGFGGLPGGVGVAGYGVGNGNGVDGYGSGVGFGGYFRGGASGSDGLSGTGYGNGNGVDGYGSGVGFGGYFRGGASGGDGLSGTGYGNGNGVDGYGAGDGYGVHGIGGNSLGSGGYFVGGFSGGDGVSGVGTGNGNGVIGHGAGDGFGGYFTGGISAAGTSSKAPMREVPQAEPTTGQLGETYTTAAGIKMVCTVAGTPATWKALGSLQTRQVLTASSGAYTTPAGCVAINVRALGGGGGGGGAKVTSDANSSLASGGSAGGVSEKLILSPASSYAYVCGAAGTAGTNAPAAGGKGGDTTFNVITVVAMGGLGGAAGEDLAADIPRLVMGAEGVLSGSAGDVTSAGQRGGNGMCFASTVSNCSGFGGTSLMGMGGAAQTDPTYSTGVAGAAGTGYGAGGSGGCIVTDSNSGRFATVAVTGGAGSAGCIIVDEYY